MSAKKRDSQKVGYTGPIRQAFPPIFSTLYASFIPRCGSGQYSILRNKNHKIASAEKTNGVAYYLLCIALQFYHDKTKTRDTTCLVPETPKNLNNRKTQHSISFSLREELYSS